MTYIFILMDLVSYYVNSIVVGMIFDCIFQFHVGNENMYSGFMYSWTLPDFMQLCVFKRKNEVT